MLPKSLSLSFAFLSFNSLLVSTENRYLSLLSSECITRSLLRLYGSNFASRIFDRSVLDTSGRDFETLRTLGLSSPSDLCYSDPLNPLTVKRNAFILTAYSSSIYFNLKFCSFFFLLFSSSNCSNCILNNCCY